MVGWYMPLLVVAASVAASDTDQWSPSDHLKKARVGDACEYELKTSFNGKPVHTLMNSVTVKYKSENEITTLVRNELDGKKAPVREVRCMIRGLRNKILGFPVGIKLEESKEAISIRGTLFQCLRFNGKWETGAKNQTVQHEQSVWICESVPLNGVVKQFWKKTTTVAGKRSIYMNTMELTKITRGK